MTALPADLADLSIAEAGKALRTGILTSRKLTEASLERIAAVDPLVNAFVLPTPERALADADAADANFANGIDHGPMQGIPYALKDIFSTADIRTTCHSNLLRENVPSEDCVVEAKLRSGGAVMLGKLGTFEFAIGGPSFDLFSPPARNPWNLEHTTSGSSSGSAAAVAAGMMRMAMGSDTGGSIRGPAAFCGTVGLKPTYGRVSRRGVYPLAFSLDHAGPLSRSVEDTAITMQVISGFDPLDPASADMPVPDYLTSLRDGVVGVRVGYTRKFFIDNPALTDEALKALDASAELLARLGAHVDEVDMPPFEIFDACNRTILFSEAYAIHEATLKARPYAYGRYAYQHLVSGALLSGADVIQAQRLRRELTAAVYNGPLASHDVLLAPNALMTAGRFDEMGPDAGRWSGILTGPFNVTGSPALALPIGFGANGLPLSAQIVGRPFAEALVLRVGAAFEAAAGIVAQRPNLPVLSKAA